jgi:exodeoxyribonuclease VII small subunit
MTTETTHNLKLEDAFAELEKITREFEQGQIDLDEGIPKFKRGLELAKLLKKRLSELENQITEITAQFEEPAEAPD